MSVLLRWLDARNGPHGAADSDVGVIAFVAVLDWIRATVCGVAYMLVMKSCAALLHRFRVYRHAYLMLGSVGLLAGLGALHSARGAFYCAVVGVVLAVIFIVVHRPQDVRARVSLSSWVRAVRYGFATRWVRLVVGFVLPLLLGPLLLALFDGWRDGSWLDEWGNTLPLVSLFMSVPTLLYTICMEIAAVSMQRRGAYSAPLLIALSTFLGFLAGGLFGVMALIGAPVGLLCGFVLTRLRNSVVD